MTHNKPASINPSMKKSQKVLRTGKVFVIGLIANAILLTFPWQAFQNEHQLGQTAQNEKKTIAQAWTSLSRNIPINLVITICAYSITISAVIIASVFLADYYRKEEGKSDE